MRRLPRTARTTGAGVQSGSVAIQWFCGQCGRLGLNRLCGPDWTTFACGQRAVQCCVQCGDVPPKCGDVRPDRRERLSHLGLHPLNSRIESINATVCPVIHPDEYHHTHRRDSCEGRDGCRAHSINLGRHCLIPSHHRRRCAAKDAWSDAYRMILREQSRGVNAVCVAPDLLNERLPDSAQRGPWARGLRAVRSLGLASLIGLGPEASPSTGQPRCWRR